MRWIMMAGLIVLGAAPASAESPMAMCGTRYQQAKSAGSLPAGQTWLRFLAACRATLPKAPDVPATKADRTSATPVSPRQPTPGQVAARARIKQCAAQYHSDKDTGKIPAGQRWPQYYSACNARLKG